MQNVSLQLVYNMTMKMQIKLAASYASSVKLSLGCILYFIEIKTCLKIIPWSSLQFPAYLKLLFSKGSWQTVSKVQFNHGFLLLKRIREAFWQILRDRSHVELAQAGFKPMTLGSLSSKVPALPSRQILLFYFLGKKFFF